jgi:hypothetical protein
MWTLIFALSFDHNLLKILSDMLKFFHKHFVVRTLFFWDMPLHHWVISFHRFEDIMFSQNVRNQLTIDVASYLEEESTITPPWKLKIHILW